MLSCTQRSRRKPQNWNQSDISASSHDFMSVSANCDTSARRVIFSVLNDVGDVVQGGLWMTWGMWRVTLYLASISSARGLGMISAHESMNAQPARGVRHIPSPPKIPSFPPLLLPYFPKGSVHLVKKKKNPASLHGGLLKCKAIFCFDFCCFCVTSPEKMKKEPRCPDFRI